MRAITLNGQTHEVDLLDLYVVRDLMDAIEYSKTIDRSDVSQVISLAEKARDAIERAVVGASPFGERLYLTEILDVLGQLTEQVKPAYEALIDDITR